MLKFLPDVIKLSVFLGILVYGNFLFNQTHSEYRALENEFIEYLLILEDSLRMYEQELKIKPKITTVYKQTPPVLLTDTLVVNSTGESLDKVYELKFSLTDRQPGSFFQTRGITSFKWNYSTNSPYDISTSLEDSQISLNVEASATVKDGTMTVDVLSPHSGVIISYVENNVIDLNKIHKPAPTRWGIGIIGGYGLTNVGATPYLGLGVTYTFKGLK